MGNQYGFVIITDNTAADIHRYVAVGLVSVIRCKLTVNGIVRRHEVHSHGCQSATAIYGS